MSGIVLVVLGGLLWAEGAFTKPVVQVEPWHNDSFAVVVDGKPLIAVRYPKKRELRRERAEEIARRLTRLFYASFQEPPTFRVSVRKDRVEAYCDETLLFSVFRDDAIPNRSQPLDLALLWLNTVQMEFYKLRSREATVLSQATGLASWCHVRFHGKLTAQGETYDSYAFTAAHRELPFGSIVLITNLRNGKQVVVKVNDRGPWRKNRLVDLSLVAAKVLGMQEAGVEKVKMEVIAWKQ